MTGQPVIVPAQFLLDRASDWDDGYALYGPEAIAAGLPPDVRETAQVVVTGGGALDPALVESLPSLRLVACFSTGFEGIDYPMLRERGIALTTASGVNAHDVADHAMALMLALWHGILPADRSVRHGEWRGFREGMAPRRSLRGRRAGIVGLGRIGENIARRAEALEMEPRWWGPRAKPDAPWPRAETVEALARWADVLFVAARSSPANEAMIGEPVLEALGPEGIVVNVSRGSLIDEPAVISALERGALGGAALDVFAHEPTDPAPWAALGDKVVLAPHLAGFTREAGRDLFGQLRENLRRHFADEPLLTPHSG